MTPAETAAILRQLHDWLRGGTQWAPTMGAEAVKTAIEMIERLEAAESDAAHQKALADSALRVAKGWEEKCNALRAKIEAAEKSDAESLAMYRKARDERDALRAAVRHEADCVEAAKAGIKALRAKTVHLASQGWRYGCHSARTGDDRPRGGQTRYIAHPWNANAGRLVVTDWLPRSCCHSERTNDTACEGCVNRGEK